MTEFRNLDAQHDTIDAALSAWRQGDCVLGELWFAYRVNPDQPLTLAAQEASNAEADLAETEEHGFVVVTQTCDIVRSCKDRPFIDVAPLVEIGDDQVLQQIRRGYRPQYGFVPGVVDNRLVADLDRTMTVEKAVVATWERVTGYNTDAEARSFARALARKRARFAFPDDFVALVSKLQKRLTKKHDRNSDEGKALRALREIRVRAAPSWNADSVEIVFWFIRDDGDLDFAKPSWDELVASWLALVPPIGRYETVDGIMTTLDDLTARDFLESDGLDLDRLTSATRANATEQPGRSPHPPKG